MSWKKILVNFGFSWSLKDILYRLDWRTPSVSSIKQYLVRNVNLPFKKDIGLPIFKGKDRDKIVMLCFKWVVDHISYQTDYEKFGVVEKWEDIDDVLETRRADCESMSTLLYVLCRIHGINPLQIKFVAGEVVIGGGTGGHAWIEYMSDSTITSMQWTILDPAYDPYNYAPFDKRKPAGLDKRYVRRWFEINDLVFE